MGGYNIYMRVLIIFNHPAPYKVSIFNELAKYVDLTVLFERTKAKDRPDAFYSVNNYQFKHIFLYDHYIGREGTLSNNVKKYIKENHQNYDVILMNGYSHYAEIKAIRYMNKAKIKYGLLINGGLAKPNEFFLKKLYKTSLVKTADFYLSPSKHSNDYLIYYGAKKDKIFNYSYSNYSKLEINNASKEEINEIRAKYNLPLDKKIFINPCQFIERKNNIYLMSLFKNRDDVLLLVGQGKLEKEYKEYIKANNLNNVIIIPFMDKKDLFDLYKASDVHITLSKRDIFGHTILESFANGTPAISSNQVISSIEYIKNGHNGYIVDLNNETEILLAMDKCDKTLGKNALISAANNTYENSGLTIYEAIKKYYE